MPTRYLLYDYNVFYSELLCYNPTQLLKPSFFHVNNKKESLKDTNLAPNLTFVQVPVGCSLKVVSKIMKECFLIC